jgi:hypothetical protein
MKYFMSAPGGISRIHIGDETTGKITSIWPGQFSGSYNVVSEILSTTPGIGGSNSPYQVYISFLSLVSKESIDSTLTAAKLYINSL